MYTAIKNAVKTVAVIGMAVGLALLIGSLGVGNESIIMVFLLSVLCAAVLTSSRSFSIGAALFSAMLFNFLFTEPRYSFLMYKLTI